MKHALFSAALASMAVFTFGLNIPMTVTLYDHGDAAHAAAIYAWLGSHGTGPDTLKVAVGDGGRRFGTEFTTTLEFIFGKYFVSLILQTPDSSAGKAMLPFAAGIIQNAPADSPWFMMPLDNEVPGFVRIGAPTRIPDDKGLYNVIDGGAVPYDSNGFVRGTICDFTCSDSLIAVEKIGRTPGTRYRLSVQPNPSRFQTMISCRVPGNPASASLTLYDAQGRRIKSFALTAGQNTLCWNGGGTPAGVYTAKLMVNGRRVKSLKIILAN